MLCIFILYLLFIDWINGEIFYLNKINIASFIHKKFIIYKLFGGSTQYSVKNDQLTNFQGNNRVIDKDALGIPVGKCCNGFKCKANDLRGVLKIY